MWIKKLVIEDYKKFYPKLEIEFNRDINLLIGVNGSGKSSILEAIVILFNELRKYANTGKPNEKPFRFYIEYSFVKQENSTSINFVQLSNSPDNLLFTSYVNELPLKSYKDILQYLPDNIICYYSGECNTLEKLINEIELEQAKQIKKLAIDFDSKNLFEILNKQFVYIRHYHYPVLFLIQYLTFSDFTLPLSKEEFSFQNIRIYIKSPSLYRASKGIKDYYGLQGVLRTFLEVLLSYTEMPKIDDDKNLYVDVFSNYFFLNAMEEMSSDTMKLYIENQDYLLFHILNLLFRIGIISEIDIVVKRASDKKIFNINDFSEGEQQLITITGLKSVLLKDNSLLLLDEPDAYLHPQRQRDFIKHLKEVNDNGFNQIIMTSHSPFVAQSISLENIDVLNEKGEVVKNLENNLDFKAILNELFNIPDRFDVEIAEDLDKFKSIRNEIMANKIIDKDALKVLLNKLENYGEEISIIVNRELAQLKSSKQFEL